MMETKHKEVKKVIIKGIHTKKYIEKLQMDNPKVIFIYNGKELKNEK